MPGGNNANQKTTNGRNAVAKAETENVTDETTVESGDKKGLGDKKRTNNNTSDTKEERQSNRKGTKVTEENLYGPTRSMEKEEKSQARIRCENSYGNWYGEYCRCPVGTKLDEKGRCKKQSLQERCDAVGGQTRTDGLCACKNSDGNTEVTKYPETDCVKQ